MEPAGALPMPVLPEPLSPERDRLRAAFVEALDNAHHTHPCPEYGKPYWTGCVHYDETGRVSGVGSCHNERRADAVLVVRDAEVESLRARVTELEAQREALAERLRAGQQWRQGRNPELVSENFVSQSELRSIFGIPLVAPWADGLTKAFAPVASLREPDGEHYPHVHHDYRKGRDLDLPQTGGTQGAESDEDRLLDGDELRRALRGHLFGGGS